MTTLLGMKNTRALPKQKYQRVKINKIRKRGMLKRNVRIPPMIEQIQVATEEKRRDNAAAEEEKEKEPRCCLVDSWTACAASCNIEKQKYEQNLCAKVSICTNMRECVSVCACSCVMLCVVVVVCMR